METTGWRVRVFERRPEPGPASTSRQRSWVLAMYPRGIRPVQSVASVPLLAERAYKGLVVVPAKEGAKPVVLERTGDPRGIRPVQSVASVPLLAERAYKGLVVVPAKEGAKPVVLERTGVLMDRTLLATSLLEAARGQYASRVEFSFGSALRDLELDRKVAVFGGEGSGSDLRVQYDMLVGADGANSTVRSLLAAAYPGQFDTEIISSGPSSGPDSGPGSYKAVYGMPVVPVAAAWAPDSSAPEADRTLGEFFFFLSGGSKGFMSVCKDIDGTFCGYLAGPESLWEGLRSREDYLAVLPSAAPQLPAEWLPLLADKLLEAPLSSFPVMRSLSRFWAPGGVVLLGDAAHTVTPALGQGLNSALQDCELLVAELRPGQAASSPESLDAALRRFSEARAPEIRALQELELLQSTSLARLNLSAGLSAVLPLLLRKWLVINYSGLALVGTVVATIAAEGRRKKRAEAAAAQAAGTGTGTAEARAAEAAAGASGVEAAQQAMADTLGAQMVATYVRSPPMYELLRGHMGYRDMLTRLYGMAALGTGCTAVLLYGIGSLLSAAAARVLAG
ncbi:hypothetical protein GPECTOR_26g521 [Gonium pectorale]|uniref:FAD-binding domain-containing protein n=1 Tax=Gonium pectorale TaxID=33097 RepID=A0A150GFJ9_GONPE|nr:hypothetical protein GPECTOR_26g521 [Gonium pectorale]|eukprot:KXZ48618.1 hypothetical protein GPECTOR_26g521 [Gonium pectorale]